MSNKKETLFTLGDKIDIPVDNEVVTEFNKLNNTIKNGCRKRSKK
jgi:hypothetical protein